MPFGGYLRIGESGLAASSLRYGAAGSSPAAISAEDAPASTFRPVTGRGNGRMSARRNLSRRSFFRKRSSTRRRSALFALHFNARIWLEGL